MAYLFDIIKLLGGDNILIYLILLYLILFVGLIALVDLSLKSRKFNKDLTESMLVYLKNDKSRLRLNLFDRISNFLLSFILTYTVLSLFFPEIANSYALIFLLIAEFIFAYMKFMTYKINVKFWPYGEQVFIQWFNVYKNNVIIFLIIFVLADIFVMFTSLMYAQNFRLIN